MAQRAIKIGEEKTEGDEPVLKKQYIILNTNSLAKRLGVASDLIVEREEAGDLDVFVQEQLQKLAEDQEKVSEQLDEIKNFLHQEGNKDKFVWVPEKRDFFIKFIQKNIDHPYLNQHVLEFCDVWLQETVGRKEDAYLFFTTILKHVWWDSERFEVKHDKVALTADSVHPYNQKIAVYHGEALNRQGHLGKPMTRVQLMDWDKDNRYAIAVGDYLYSSKPKEYPSTMVPLRLHPQEGEESLGEEKWVLVNVHSLGRLGLSNEIIEKEADLYKIIKERIAVLNTFNDCFEADFNPLNEHYHHKKLFIERGPKAILNEFLEDYRLQHPEPEIKGFFQKMIQREKYSDVLFDEIKNKIGELKACSFPKSIHSESRTFFGKDLPESSFREMGVSGDLTIAFVFTGTAKELPGHFPHLGHAGNAMARLNFFAWDSDQRYAIAHRGKIYPHKPVNCYDKEVPMMLLDKDQRFQGWLLMNVHSLGRLGLSSEVIHKAADENQLHILVSQQLEKIDSFNRAFQAFDKLEEGVDMSSFQEFLNTQASNHPDQEISEILNKAKQSGSVLQELRQKLEAAGAIEKRTN